LLGKSNVLQRHIRELWQLAAGSSSAARTMKKGPISGCVMIVSDMTGACVEKWLGQKLRKSEQREPLELEVEGRTFSGSYTLSSGMVHVISLYGRKSIQLDGSPPDLLAERLLRQIIQESTVKAVRKK
jgi:hypothetical protein